MFSHESIIYKAIIRFFEISAALVLLILMVLTCADVIGRYFFNRPVWGAFELTEALLAMMIFFGLPLVTLRREHIEVDMLTLPAFMDRFRHVAVSLIGAVGTAFLAYRLWLRGDQLWRAGETTMQLAIPLGYVAYVMSLLAGVTAIAFLIVATQPPAHKAVTDI